MKVNHFTTKGCWDYYLEVPAALTYKIYNDDSTKTAAIVHWSFATDEEYIHGNNFDKLRLTIEYLKDKYKMNRVEEKTKRVDGHKVKYEDVNRYKLVVFTVDLDLLYEFIKHEFKCDIFNVNGKGIASCIIEDVIEFRDVEFIGTDRWREFSNNENKLAQLLDYAKYYFENIAKTEGSGKLPITIQQVIKDKIKENMTSADKAFVESIYPGENEYLMAKKYLYIGGFCDTRMTDKYEGSVGHIDFKTSYVARMLTEGYPMSRFTRYPTENLHYALKHNCCIIKVVYYNFRANKFKFLTRDKAVSIENPKYDSNGRIISADKVELYINELDFELISNCYKYDTMVVLSLFCATKGQLPKYVRKVAEDYYADKETLEKNSVDQIWAKLCTEVVYGTCSTGLFGIGEKPWKEFKEKAVLSPYWGIWTASHARYALVSFCKMLEEDWLYSDTDSLFFKNPYLHVQLIEKYNAARRAIMYKYCDENDLDYNVFSELGTFTYEDGSDCNNFVISAFKALGPKRYIFTISNKRIITKIAGYKKQYMTEAGTSVNIWSKVFGDSEAMYDAFEETTKLKDVIKVSRKIDEPYTIEYNGEVYHCKSGKWIGYMISNISMKDMFEMQSILDEQLKETQKNLGREQI